MKNRLGIFLLLFVISISVYPYSFRYVNIEDGLSSRRVFQIEKDANGFMWFVTYMGVDRYDGSEMRHYKLKNNDEVEENFFSSTKMVCDTSGIVWVAVQDGQIFKYNKEKDCFDLELDLSGKLSNKNILLNSITIDKKNRLWICSTQGLYLYDDTDKRVHSIISFQGKGPTIVIQKSVNRFYVGTLKGVYELEEKAPLDFVISGNNKLTVQCGRVESLLYYNNKLFIGTESRSAFLLDLESGLCSSLSSIVPNVPVRSIQYMPDDKILIGADGSGLYCVDASTGKLINSFIADDDVKKGLSGNTVYDIYVDEMNCIWVSTYTNGISVLDPLSPNIQLIRHEYKNNNSLVNSHVNIVLEDSDGDMWYGTNNGLSVYHAKNNQWKHYFNNWENKAVILSLCEDKQKRMWVGGFGLGAYCIDRRNGTIKAIPIDDNKQGRGISSNHIYSIYADNTDVWFGGLNNGITQYNIEKEKYTYHGIDGAGEIKELNDSILLFGTASGLYVFNKWTGYFKGHNEQEGALPNRAVRSLFTADNGDVWLGTEGNGLICFHPETERSELYTIKQGLSSDYIYSIAGDRNGRLWFTTERTLSYIDLKSKHITNIGEYIGLNDLNYNPHVSFIRRNGNIVFGTSDGAIEFPSDFEPEISIKTKLILTDFKLFYNSVKVGQEHSPLQKAINETSVISLAYDQNSFSFDYSAINFRYPTQIIYSYTLEGFDQQWYMGSNSNNVVNYTNINPGNYVFRLKALNKDTKEVLDERFITIEVCQPFWKSSWALIVYFILMIIILRFIIIYMKNKIEKRNSKEKIQFFINVAHDIRTPVTLIKAPLSELEEKETLSDSGKVVLDIAIKNTEKLFTMVSQLLDFQKADISALRLIISKNELKSYIQEKIMLFRVEAEHKRIALSLEYELDHPLVVWFDREKMDKILGNLISNAIKYTQEGGTVILKVFQDEKKWYLTLSDTGIGIPASEQKYLFRRFFRAHNAINSKETGSGIGLLLTRKLVKLHSGEISFISKENVGTEFTLSFLKGDSYFIRNQVLEELTHTAPKIQVIEDAVIPTESTPDLGVSGIKILLVEDNDDMRLFLKNSLSQEYCIAEAVDGQEGLEKVSELNPDLIISDVMMPRMNGVEMCTELKNSIETSHIPIILLTALTDKENIIKGFDCGADDYVMKPFDAAVLKARIRNILRNRQNIRDVVLSSDIPCEEVEYMNPLDKEFMEKAVFLIEQQLDNSEYAINDFCADLGMSRSSVYNKLRALTEQGPNDFIRLIRLKKAAELLKSERYNVNEVATMTGFSDSKYFSTAFKKQFGVSPSKFSK